MSIVSPVLDSFPNELYLKILEHLPLNHLLGLSRHNVAAFDLAYKNMVLRKVGFGSHNEFDSLDSIQRFLDENPYFTPNHLTVESDEDLKGDFDYHQFKFISVRMMYHTPPEHIRDMNFKEIALNDQFKTVDPEVIAGLSVENITLYNGDSNMVPLMVQSLTLVNSPITMDQLNQYKYLKDLNLYGSITEFFQADLPNLKHLLINDFAEKGKLTNLKSVESLEIHNVEELSGFPPNLKALVLSDGKKLKGINEIKNLTGLRSLTLNLYYVCNTANFYKIEFPPLLVNLSIVFQNTYFDVYNEINHLKLPTCLQLLELMNCEDLVLSEMQLPSSLEHLKISNILGFNNFKVNRSLKSLHLENVFDFHNLDIPIETRFVVNNSF